VKVDRTTLFGNPFTAEQHGRSGAIRMFELWLEGQLPGGSFPDQATAMLMTKRQMVLERLPARRGKSLACWCPLPEPGERDICHATVLLERANSGC
jgi:hypothetical protein